MIERLFSKIKREIYRLFHPGLWRKKLQINGIPCISDYKNIKFGMNVSINQDVVIQGAGGVVIGNNVTLSRDVKILTEGLDTYHYIENARRIYRSHIKKNVVIGEGVWIAAGAIVCPGVEVARNSIVAAGAVVSKSLLEEGVLYGGVPAKKIKDLDEERVLQFSHSNRR